MTHELKIWPEYYKAVAEGRKTFEYRRFDRSYSFGDTVVLKEWSPRRDYIDATLKQLGPPKGYTGSPDLKFKIGYMIELDDGYVIFSLLPFEDDNDKPND